MGIHGITQLGTTKMVDFINPLPPIASSRIVKTKVTEKDSHHQQKRQHQERDYAEEEVHDAIVIASKLQEDPQKNKKSPPSPLAHKIDIEV